MADEAAQDAIRQWERLEGDRGTFMMHWQDCANYILPNRSDYITRHAPGQKRMQRIYEGTAVWANEQFAAGMHSMLTSPTLRWFTMRAEDDALNQKDSVQTWLDQVSERMYSLFNGPRHNFASQSTELYLDIGSIGTAVMFVGQSPQSGILFSTRHLRECCLAESEEDRIDTCVRKWKWTAKQAFQKWGEAAGAAVLETYARTPDREMHFLHRVKPRLNRDPQRADRRHKPWESLTVSMADQSVIDEGGFDEFPYLCPRLAKVSGEIYGRSPGMTALPDVKMLNEMMKLVVKAAQKVIDPPLMVPDDGFLLPVKTTPGSLNSYRAGSRDRIEPLKTEGDVNLGIEMINALRQQIIRSFYVEWLMMPSDPRDPAAAGKGVTATYVLQQRDEKMRLLSPMLARLQSEFLGPLIDRVFAIMWRQSVALRFGPGAWLPAPPPELAAGVPLRVEYVSPIAVAQKTSQLDVVGRLIQTQAALQQMAPNDPIILDIEAIMRLTGRDLNAPPLVLRSPDAMAQIRDQQAKAAQEAAQHAALANVASSVKDVGTAAQSFGAAAQNAPGLLQGGGGLPAAA